jgi:hypothetical protein
MVPVHARWFHALVGTIGTRRALYTPTVYLVSFFFQENKIKIYLKNRSIDRSIENIMQQGDGSEYEVMHELRSNTYIPIILTYGCDSSNLIN